jgi:hypothetical protein
MSVQKHDINIAILDDYQGVALDIADWSEVGKRANISVFRSAPSVDSTGLPFVIIDDDYHLNIFKIIVIIYNEV